MKIRHWLLLLLALTLPLAAQKQVRTNAEIVPITEEPSGEIDLGDDTSSGGDDLNSSRPSDGGETDVAPSVTNHGAEAMAFDGTYIWIARQFTDTLLRVDAKTGSKAGNFKVGRKPVSVTFAAGSIWVANLESDNIMRLNLDGSIALTIPTGDGPGRIAYDGANVWVANRNESSVTKIHAGSGAVVGTYKVGKRPTGVAFDGTHIWVANNLSDSVTKLRASDGVVLGTYAVGRGPFDVAFDNVNVWVTNFFDGTVTRLKTDGAVIGTYSVGDGAAGIILAGQRVCVASSGTNSVVQLDASSGTVAARVDTGAGPFGGVFDGVNLWIANWAGNSISVRKVQ